MLASLGNSPALDAVGVRAAVFPVGRVTDTVQVPAAVHPVVKAA